MRYMSSGAARRGILAGFPGAIAHADAIYMKLIDLNRDGGIGANSLFVQLGGLNILIDSGP